MIKYKYIKLILGFLMMSLISCDTSSINEKPAYKQKGMPIEKRVKDLLQRMTVEEKAGQLNQLVGDLLTGPESGNADWQNKLTAIENGEVGAMLNVVGVSKTRHLQQAAMKSRLGIPLLFGYDVIHGFKTIFPIPLAEACSWNIEQIKVNATVAAKEASAAGLHWTFAPMCDISMDPRWGRVMEGIGEDPWYGGLVSAARVKGFQGNGDSNHVLATVKHFAAYGAVEGGKEYNYTDMSRQELWNRFLPPYKAAIEAGAASVMNGFTTFEGVPVTGSNYLNTEVLQNKWGFKGFMVSDWNSIGEMIAWGYATDNKDAVYKAFQAGSMMDMESKAMIRYIPELVKEGKIKERDLDDVVGRVLYYKFKLGLFDNPYAYCDEERERENIFTKEHRMQALEAARQSIVLLKNEKQTLPLVADGKQKIALIGYYAKSKDDILDFWVGQGDAQQVVSLYEGFSQHFGAGTILFSNGYDSTGQATDETIEAALITARNADVVVVNAGLSGKLAGEDRSMANPELPQGQIKLLQALKKTGKPIVAIISAGRPLILTPIIPYCDAILYTWILGTESGNAIAEVVAGVYNPSGKTVMSFPAAIGQIPVYYNHVNTGRPNPTDDKGNWYSRYRDVSNDPLFPFGYGLSYTRFTYSNLQISDSLKKVGNALNVKVSIANEGQYDGEEVVQLYIRDLTSSVIRPVKELKGFQKIFIRAGDTKIVEFVLADEELSFLDASGNAVLEPGYFHVFVGGNSRDVQKAIFRLE